MDYLPSLINAAVIAAIGVLITYVTRTQIRDLKVDIAEVGQDIRDLRNEVVSIRSDLTQVALVVGAQPRPQTG